MLHLQLKEILKQAFIEDIGMGDLSSNSIYSKFQLSKGVYTAKADGVLAGLQAIELGYKLLDELAEVTFFKKDGDSVKKGESIAEVEASVRALLSGERVILNLMQHMGGIATATATAVSRLDDSSITVTDTRKTLPGLRSIQKYSVLCGGGKNHRFRLDDCVMIKDNHIKAAGSIKKAVEKARNHVGHTVKIEVETESKEQVLEALQAGADIIMFDNRSANEVKDLVSLVPDSITTEVSGGITLDNISEYNGCGVNVISLGWLTHSVKALDISFNLK